MYTRRATLRDADAIACIYTQGIQARTATFETAPRSAADVVGWFSGPHPVVVVVEAEEVVAFAATFPYRPRACYAGIAEFSVYVADGRKGQGFGRAAMEALLREAARADLWKLVSRVFPENTASRALLASLGFREVGMYQNHAQLDGIWRDVVIVERFLK